MTVIHCFSSMGGSTWVTVTSQDSTWYCILATQVNYFRTCPGHQEKKKIKMLCSKLLKEGKMLFKSQPTPITKIGEKNPQATEPK